MKGFGGETERKRPLIKIILKYIFKKQNGKSWTGLIWLRIGTKCEMLCK